MPKGTRVDSSLFENVVEIFYNRTRYEIILRRKIIVYLGRCKSKPHYYSDVQTQSSSGVDYSNLMIYGMSPKHISIILSQPKPNGDELAALVPREVKEEQNY